MTMTKFDKRGWASGLVLALVLLFSLGPVSAQSPTVFDSPQAAVAAIPELIEQHDEAGIERVFGPGSVDLFRSGDDAADREDAQRVVAMIGEEVAFEEFDQDTLVALFGANAWPWPIPLVRAGDGWRFDTAAGRQELLNRRIGRNELWTLAALYEIVEAQREYRQVGRDGNPPAYAQQFRSTEGKHDGLYWPASDTQGESPLGHLLADSEPGNAEPRPFNGYYYRILTARGADTPGGERSYLDEQGLLTHGFGVVAWPAKYGNSGVMTFITNQRGLVFQKDLGEDTAQAAGAVESFNPDASWSPTSDAEAFMQWIY